MRSRKKNEGKRTEIQRPIGQDEAYQHRHNGDPKEKIMNGGEVYLKKCQKS
jgi:hypothetical protein